MDWIKEIFEKHKKEDGTYDITKAMDEVKAEFPKNAVPKAVYNQASDDLKTANKLVDDLKKGTADTEVLQKKITDYEASIETLKAERLAEKKTYALKDALKAAGATDVDYMLFKLGDVEVDKEGNVIELDNKIKSLKEANPTQFPGTEPGKGEEGKGAKGFEVIDTGLETGKPSTPEATATAAFEAAMGLS